MEEQTEGAKKLPYIKLYVNDWLGDVDLMSCSNAAQGFFMKLVCRMHVNKIYGALARADGKGGVRPMTMPEIAKLTGDDPQETELLIKVLFNNGVLKMDTDTGIFFSRRMLKDADLRRKRSDSGLEGSKVTNKRFAAANSNYDYNSDNSTLFNKEEEETVEDRQDKFIDVVSNLAHGRGWPKIEVESFVNHWTEISPRGRKMKFEKQPTFDVARRMTTWELNYKKWNDGKELKGQSGQGGPSALDGLED